MVMISERFRGRWDGGHELREIVELESFAAMLMTIYGTGRSARPG